MEYTMIFFAITTFVWLYYSITFYIRLNKAENMVIQLYLDNEKLKADLGNAPAELTRLTAENMRLEREIQRNIWKKKK